MKLSRLNRLEEQFQRRQQELLSQLSDEALLEIVGTGPVAEFLNAASSELLADLAAGAPAPPELQALLDEEDEQRRGE